jgi:glycosyltransferase involved in cell wall biosynthesis
MPKITVILVIRNRPQKMALNCVRSLQQNCKIILVDYGSNEENLRWEREMCEKYGINLIEVTRDTDIFNKCRALNIGIKRVTTPYTMTGDIDIIYKDNFIEEVEKVMSDNRLVTCRRLNMDEEGNITDKHQNAWGGCFILPTKWLIEVHGFDEKYTMWGREDNDLFDRAIQNKFQET